MRELRELNRDNLELARRTRNAVRQFLFYNEEISKEQQSEWFSNVYMKSPEKIYLCYTEGQYVGCCQFDPDTREIAIRIEPDCQGCGYGYQFLEMLLKSISGKVIAKVKLNNIASINLFIKVGFKIEDITDIVIMSRIIEP